MKIRNIYATVLFSGLLSPFSVWAIDCGDIITAPTTLDRDLLCVITEQNEVALTIEGPRGSLNMDGFQLTCDDEEATGQAGILLTGIGAQVYGGIIAACRDGVNAEGEGSHSIYSMEIIDTIFDAIYIESNNSIARDNIITNSDRGDGIELNGNTNTVTRNTITGIDNSGIELRGSFNNISFNEISGSGNQGIEVNGQFTNVFSNIVTNGLNDGIAVGEGDESDNADFSTISLNNVSGNSGLGIPIRLSSNTLVTQNTVESNGEGGIGIFVEGSEFNKIVRNTSLNNSPYDLEDDTDPGDCSGTNTWVFNTFTAAEPACLD
ncbi:right-handed parallel beta-helix repeat-containing protein [Microbulbifer sp. VAAF005]|uniref:right-handed parallel beta-helix repeat-containing protein n=1 Tax=Microbulbifer sp. VAAF005 TaxID=3034230 RepID=UPI0024AD6256|nr:right-handed parallel beta-helix repeat-containing protein [Microbulbifer sp. VAAF005]WHI44994.1 right-handed parallel beta-helix repeat-containing protein [Microbulbifer sp. VAAF005]